MYGMEDRYSWKNNGNLLREEQRTLRGKSVVLYISMMVFTPNIEARRSLIVDLPEGRV